MSQWRKKIGALGEDAAKDYLVENGFIIVERNYTCRYGEIDIVAKEQDTLVFVEVRAKTVKRYGLPEESIGKEKMKRLIKLVYHYLAKKNGMQKCRIDLIAVEIGRDNGRVNAIRHIRGIR